jgi:hypothetical protein
MNPSSGARQRPFGVLRSLALFLVLLATAACSGGSSGGGGTAAPAGPTAAELLADAKSNLENLAAQDHSGMGALIDAFKKFDTAYQADTTSQEAAFYTGLGSVLLFLDSASTTAFLSQLGLSDFRTEADLCQAYNTVQNQSCPYSPFQIGKPLMVGGSYANTADYVRLSMVQVETYLTSDILGAIAGAANVLSGIGPSFAGTFHDLRQNKTIELDAADAYLVRAFLQFLQLGAQFPELWDLRATDLDTLFDNDSGLARFTTGPTTGDFVSQTNANATFKTFYGDSATLASKPTGLAAMKTLLSGIFGSLRAAVDSLLAETDDQSNDFFTIGNQGGTPDYDRQDDASRFSMKLLGDLAGQLKDAFGPNTSGAQTLTIRNAVATITNFGECTPVTGQTPDLYPNTRGGPFFGSVAGFSTATAVVNIDGVTPNPGTTGAPIGQYYVYKLHLTAAANLSIWTGDSTPAHVHTELIMAYAPGISMVSWDNDSHSAGNDHGGISIASNYFGSGIAGLPSIGGGGLDLYIFVQAQDAVTKASSTLFNLYVWADTASTPPTGVPIFLQGRGRNFHVDLYENHGSFDAKAAVAVMSEFFQNTNRGTFTLDDPATPLVNESFLEMGGTTWTAQVQRAVPDATVTMVGTNMLADEWDVTNAVSSLAPDSSIAVPPALNSFCAYPWTFGDQGDEIAGGFSLH